jgi:His-Xaa-Ser system protein HxsD
MANLRFPVIELEASIFQIKADLTIYAQEALTATCHKYSGDFYVHQEKDANNDNIIIVTFETKDEHKITSDIAKQFCTDLIDQQLRVETNKQFGHIRDLIVEEAFKPITPKE